MKKLYEKCKEIIQSKKILMLLAHQAPNPYMTQLPMIDSNPNEVIFVDYLTPLKEPGKHNEKKDLFSFRR